MMRVSKILCLLMLVMVCSMTVSAFAAEPFRMKYALTVYSDEKGNGFNQPEGVACTGDKLIIADTGNGRLLEYSLVMGEPKGGKEIKLAQLPYPTRVLINSKGDIYVLDGRQRKIARLKPDGTFSQYVDLSAASGDISRPVVPVGIAIDESDTLYVLDEAGSRVIVVNNDGKIEREIPFPQKYGFITDVAADSKGNLFLTDAVNAVIYSATKDATAFSALTPSLKEDLKFASNIATDNKGALFVSDQNSGGIVVIGRDGTFRNRLLTFGWREGMIRYPAQICIDPQEGLFVADRGNYRIQKFVPLQ